MEFGETIRNLSEFVEFKKHKDPVVQDLCTTGSL
jgi:hypothetical protein